MTTPDDVAASTSETPTSKNPVVFDDDFFDKFKAAMIAVLQQSIGNQVGSSNASGETRAPRVRKVDRSVVPFRGYGGQEDPIRWLFEHFESAARRNGWSDNDKLTCIESYLSEEALAWWTTNRESFTHWSSGDRHTGFAQGSLTHGFLQRFVTPEMRAHWNDNFQSCAQRAGEDVTQFANRLRELNKRVGFFRLVHDDEVSKRFHAGLPLALRNSLSSYAIMCGKPNMEFEERVRIACQFEYHLRANKDVSAVTISGATDPQPDKHTDRVVTSSYMPTYSGIPSPSTSLSPSTTSTEAAPPPVPTPSPVAPEPPAAPAVVTTPVTCTTPASKDAAIEELVEEMKQLRIMQAALNKKIDSRSARRCPHCGSTDRKHSWRSCQQQPPKEGFLAAVYDEEGEAVSYDWSDTDESPSDESYDEDDDDGHYQVVADGLAAEKRYASDDGDNAAKRRATAPSHDRPAARSKATPRKAASRAKNVAEDSNRTQPMDTVMEKVSTSKDAGRTAANQARELIISLVQAPRAKGANAFSPADVLADHVLSMRAGDLAQLLIAQSNSQKATHAPRRSSKATQPVEADALAAYDEGTRALRAYAYFRGQPFEVVIDTGAAYSLIGGLFVQRHGLQIDEPSSLMVLGASGESRKAEGIIRSIPFRFGGAECTISPHVIPNGPYAILLGMDWMRKHRAIVDTHDNQVRFHHQGRDYVALAWATESEAAVARMQLPADCQDGRIEEVSDDEEPAVPHADDEADMMDEVAANTALPAVEVFSALVTSADIVIPPRDRYTWRPPRSLVPTGRVLMEPEVANTVRHGVVALPGFGPARRARMCLINPSASTITIPADTLLGRVVPEPSVVRRIRSRTDLVQAVAPPITGDVMMGEVDANADTTAGTISDKDFEAAIDSQLDPSRRRRLLLLLRQHEQAFAKNDQDLGLTDLAEFSVDTGDAQPVNIRPYRYGPKETEYIVQEVEKMLKMGLVEPCSGPWCFPIVLVKKKDGSLRFCVDYRKLNSVTKRDVYPLPRVDDIYDALHGASWFSSLDGASAYHQCHVTESSRDALAFSAGSRTGLLRWKRLPFGVAGAPSFYQRLMDKVLSGLLWVCAFAYLDDTEVFSATFNDHLEHLHLVLSRIADAGLKLKLRKCRFAARSLVFLGFTTSADGLSPDPAKVEKMLSCPPPRNIKELRSFHGLASYYRRFIVNFARLTAPLRELFKADAEYVWGPEQQQSFENVKQALTAAPILLYPDFDKPFTLDTDASYDGLGAVLSQSDADGRLRPVLYISRATTPAERNLSVTELEATAVMWALEQCRHYVLGSHVHIRTDHQALPYIARNKTLNRKLARWALALSEYSYTMEYRPGGHNAVADALSRPPFVPDTAASAENVVNAAYAEYAVIVGTAASFDTAVVATTAAPLAATTANDAMNMTAHIRH